MPIVDVKYTKKVFGVKYNQMYNTAIILAAGQGSRLKPLTNTVPKPLVLVTDKTIIHNALNNLEDVGVKEVYIVTGYLGEILQSKLGTTFKNLKIFYITNESYASTNSMYSLLLGLKQIPQNENVLILEGDVFFEPSVIAKIPIHPITWFADSSISELDGCYLKSKADKVSQIGIYKHNEIKNSNGYIYAKSVGILAVENKYIQLLITWLKKAVEEKKTNLYYDLILAEHIKELDIRLLDISEKKWFEIDSVEDLQVCTKIFNND
jgi:choline kinase